MSGRLWNVRKRRAPFTLALALASALVLAPVFFACSPPVSAPPSAAAIQPRPPLSARVAAPASSASGHPAAPVSSAPEAPAPSEPPPLLIEQLRSDRQWTGVAASLDPSRRLFVSYPRWSDKVPVSVEEISFGVASDERGSVPFIGVGPYPDEEWNAWRPGLDPRKHFVAVQSVLVTEGTLWVLDAGNPKFGGVVRGAPKLVVIDLTTDAVRDVIPFDAKIASGASYLNDVRIDLSRGFAYITDSGKGGLVVLDLLTKKAQRVLDNSPSTHAEDTVLTIEGAPWRRPDGSNPKVHVDGIALSPDGEWLYYQALTGRTLYRIATDVLRSPRFSNDDRARWVQVVGTLGPADGLATMADGSIIHTSLEANALVLVRPDGTTKTLVQDPRLAWPDSLAFGRFGELWVTTSRIHRGGNPGEPYGLWVVPQWAFK
ncbi:MAG TPA: L-dopachrome tautomerase-related protein [Polyangiaceae bacterium]|nr:L-dopachrome tautomerase-related protein [Polyangiaceae bacterium]